MALQLGALRDALIDAGAQPDKAARAAEEAAGYETRLARIDAKLTVALWAGGLLFAAVLTSQAALWLEIGKIGGTLTQMTGQLAHIEQLAAAQR
jgi:hypothetical protein